MLLRGPSDIALLCQILDGSSSVHKLHRCGDADPDGFESNGDVLKVRFKTDGTKRARGFRARYEISHAGRHVFSINPCAVELKKLGKNGYDQKNEPTIFLPKT